MLLSDLSDDERARQEAWHNEYHARERAEQQAKIQHYEGLLTSIGAEIAAATEALADLNRRAVRDALRGLLARHPRLDRVSVNLSTAYNDDTYFFGVGGLWLEDTYVSTSLSDGPGYDPFQGFSLPRWPDSPPRPFVLQTWNADYQRPAWVPGDAPPETGPIREPEREAYGDLYDVAADAVATVRAFAPFGLHFWADGFGYGAIVEATRTEMRILPQHYDEDSKVQPFDSAWAAETAREAGIPLGSVTSAYASDHARAPHVAVRLARTPDLDLVETALIGLLVREAQAPLIVPGSIYRFGVRVQFSQIEAISVGPFEIPVVRVRNGSALDETAMDALAAGPPLPLDNGGTLAFTPEVREAARARFAALRGLEARFGRRRLRRFFEPKS